MVYQQNKLENLVKINKVKDLVLDNLLKQMEWSSRKSSIQKLDSLAEDV